MATPITKAPQPVRISADHYRIDSFTYTLHAYDLRRNEHGAWECSCQGFHYNRRCKHVRTLMAHLGERERVAPVGLTLHDLFS